MTIAKLHDGRKISFPPGTSKADIQAAVKKMLAPPAKPAVSEGARQFDAAASRVALTMQNSGASNILTNKELTKSIAGLQDRIADLGEIKKVFSSIEALAATIAEQARQMNSAALTQIKGVDDIAARIAVSHIDSLSHIDSVLSGVSQAHEGSSVAVMARIDALLNGIEATHAQGMDGVARAIVSQVDALSQKLVSQNDEMLRGHERKMAEFTQSITTVMRDVIAAMRAPRDIEVKRDFRGRVEGGTSKIIEGVNKS